MSVLKDLACMHQRRDEKLNIRLAGKLVRSKDPWAIREVAECVWSQDKAIAHDCIKVLYEIGSRAPSLIASYAEDFVKLLQSKDNRMTWGAATALATIAGSCADALFPHATTIMKAVDRGSVITQDNGISALASIAASNERHAKKIVPFLFAHIRNCRPKEVPMRAEKIIIAVSPARRMKFIDILKGRRRALSKAQLARVDKLIKRTAAL